MATKVQCDGLGFEKLFRRKGSSVERAKDTEKCINTTKEDADTSLNEEKEACPSKLGKFFGQQCPEDKNDLADDTKTTAKEIDEANSPKTNDSKKSSKKKKSGSCPENSSCKTEDDREDSEACRQYVIKDNVGQVKLTEMINNSIKEAVLNIVKEGVSPLTDSLDIRAKDTGRKLACCAGQETQDKENKPGSPKHLSSLLSGANKTFDSHFYRNQYQQPSRSASRSPCKLNDQHEKVTVNHCSREPSPRANKKKKVIKCAKQKDKCVRESSPKICRQTKGQSSHFKTDNRRMTGNVNIYICSEANENAKDKQNPKKKKDCVDDTESASSSTSSVSTSKLVAALKKKQRKNLEDQSLSCVCEMPESSVKEYRSDSKIVDCDTLSGVNDALSVCKEDCVDAEFPSTQSTSSSDTCVCEDTKFSDLDFPCSDMESLDQPCTSGDSDEHNSYDRNNSWPCLPQNFSCYDGPSRSRRYNAPKQSGNANNKDIEEQCSCCNSNRCKNDRPIVSCSRNWKYQIEHRKIQDKTCRTSRDMQQFNKCLCVVEEEDEDCCNDRKESEEKFRACIMPSTHEEYSDAQEQKNEPEKQPSESFSDVMKTRNESADSPKDERNTSVQIPEIDSIIGQKTLDKTDEPNVEGDIDSKPKSPKPTLMSILKKNFKRSGKENAESKITSPEISKEVDQVKNTVTNENEKKSEASKNDGDNGSPVADEKQKNSFFFRSIKKAMDIVKTLKDDSVAAVEGDENSRKGSAEQQTVPKVNDDEKTNGEGNAKGTGDRSSNGIDMEKIFSNSGDNFVKQDKLSRSRISVGIASRRSCGSACNKNSNINISCNQANKPDDPTCSSGIHDTIKTECSEQGLPSCQCGKLSERSDCRCKKPEPEKDETCKCYVKCRKSSSSISVCCKKPVSPRNECCACCPKCGIPVDECICCSQNPEPIEPDSCKCCPRCCRPISQCKCWCSKQEMTNQELTHLCCCDLEQNLRVVSSQLSKCRQSPICQENRNLCNNCCSPKAECRCCQTFPSWQCPKSMICIYCDKPQDNCTCTAPIRKCSQCALPLDVCNCKPLSYCEYSGRQITQAEENDEPTICVTAWKPRRNIRQYFAREQNDVDGTSEDDCACYDVTKPYGSDRLPYQKGSIFSDVMSELQQKISGSVCCNVCRNVPCNCYCIENEYKVERRPRQRLSTIAERRNACQSQDRLRSKAPTESCRCGTSRKNSGKQAPVSKICDRCRTSPCRCRRGSASPKKKLPPKCYYCKSSPCICAPDPVPANPRTFRKADSSYRRKKECNSGEEHMNADVKNEDNRHRGRESNHVVPYPERQQLRQYCHRENSSGQRTSNTGQCVR